MHAYLVKQAPLLVCVFLFCLLFFPIASSICFILLVIISFTGGNMKTHFKKVSRQQALVAMILFYLMHVVSLIYSSNLNFAFFDLGEKISFLLMPLVLSYFTFTARDLQRFKYFFIAGVECAAAGCIIAAFYHYSQNNEIEDFFYTALSNYFHPAYITIYLNLAVLFLLDDYFIKGNAIKKYHVLFYILIPFTIAFIIMLSSRTAWTVTLITIVIYFSILFYRRKLVFREKIFSISMIVMISVFQFLGLKIYNRFSGVSIAIRSATDMQTDVHHQDENGSAARIYLWKNAFELIKKNIYLGVGVGDVKDELMKVYAKNNYQNGIEKKLNPHNQYLQTAVALGIPGLLMLVWVFAVSAWESYKKQDVLCFLLVIIVAMNCMTESILERQAGIVFFSFFYVLFLNFSTQHDQPGSHQQVS